MKLKNLSTFHLVWLAASLGFSFYVMCQISPQVFNLPTEKIPFERIPGGQCKADNTCSILGKSEDIDADDISKQLEGFNNFFPLSAISRLNLKFSTQVNSNLNFEVTYPKFSAKVNDIKISCEGNPSPKFETKGSDKWVKGVRDYAVSYEVHKFYECENASISTQFIPEGEVVVGPNEYVKIVTNDSQLPTLFLSGSVTAEPSFLTKIIIFLVTLFLSLGAGSILFSFYQNLRKR